MATPSFSLTGFTLLQNNRGGPARQQRDRHALAGFVVALVVFRMKPTKNQLVTNLRRESPSFLEDGASGPFLMASFGLKRS